MCHHAEVAKDFQCVFCNVIGGWKILRRKQSTVERHQTLSSRVGSGDETKEDGTLEGQSRTRLRRLKVIHSSVRLFIANEYSHVTFH